jgi:hypothetical protein
LDLNPLLYFIPARHLRYPPSSSPSERTEGSSRSSYSSLHPIYPAKKVVLCGRGLIRRFPGSGLHWSLRIVAWHQDQESESKSSERRSSIAHIFLNPDRRSNPPVARRKTPSPSFIFGFSAKDKKEERYREVAAHAEAHLNCHCVVTVRRRQREQKQSSSKSRNLPHQSIQAVANQRTARRRGNSASICSSHNASATPARNPSSNLDI